MSDEPMYQVRERRLLINRLDEWLYEEISPFIGQRVLEIGSGHGNLVEHLVNREVVIATDFDNRSVDILKKNSANSKM